MGVKIKNGRKGSCSNSKKLHKAEKEHKDPDSTATTKDLNSFAYL